ncbi:lipase 1-like [Frankliniella occidentalis]|uniref:Lipase 1-like n=1 Tax=Frankliniella occidentalis TaxID=133901 RepID=A0A9C6WX99_FRAOC|nr:lipase 1-like [Frankliniella occidentalis]
MMFLYVFQRLLELMVSHFPAGASNRQVLHYAQSIMAGGNFQKYDFGPSKNKQVYGTKNPPGYNLRNISSPMYVYYSSTDALVNDRDVEDLAKSLPVIKRLQRVTNTSFNHIDFLIGSMAYEAVYKHVIRDLLSHVHK